MSYTFETELLGPTAEIEGTFDAGEKPSLDCPGELPSFEIESITINDVLFEIDCLCSETLDAIHQEAFDDAHANHDPY